MSEKEPRKPDRARKPRPRTEKGPGAHSGAEQQAQERVVPGTASAREGYQTKGGTAGGESLAGVESAGEERSAQSAKGDVTHTPAIRKRHK